MDLRAFLANGSNSLARNNKERFARLWKTTSHNKGDTLVRQGDGSSAEYILLNGRMIGHISDTEGRAVCVGFYDAPCVVTPNVARTRQGCSLVTIEVVHGSLVAQIEARTLSEKMIEDLIIREWANGILQDELARKADREWCLSALGGAERLKWFRERYPQHEGNFGHASIASYLGMTPVTLSRLRSAAPDADKVPR